MGKADEKPSAPAISHFALDSTHLTMRRSEDRIYVGGRSPRIVCDGQSGSADNE